MSGWRGNFAHLWTVQLISSLGWTVAQPFLPLYVQELGVSGVREAALWAGLLGFVGGLGMALASPVWGVVADRYGRKLMVQRATFGGGIAQALMGLASSAPQLVALRGVQGMLGGTVPAIMALAAAIVPQSSLGFALGALQTAVSLGTAAGPLLGGWLANAVGYRPTFYATGMILFVAWLVTVIGVRDRFMPPPRGERPRRIWSELRSVVSIPNMAGLLVVVAAARGAHFATIIAIPLVLQEMAGGDPRVSGQSGVVLGLAAVVMAIAAMVWGRLGDRLGQARVLLAALGMAAVVILPQVLVQRPWQLALGQMAFAAGLAGTLPSSNALIGMIGPRGREGAVYGASGTALAVGSALGPALAGAIMGSLGTRAIFGCLGAALGALFVMLRVSGVAARVQGGG